MDPRKLIAAIGIAVSLVACGDPSGAQNVANPVTGVITKVGPDYIVLETDSGEKIRFDNADTEIGRTHLQVHKKQKLPVKVTHEPNGDRLVARRIEDAPLD